jgi:hypothetical protein
MKKMKILFSILLTVSATAFASSMPTLDKKKPEGQRAEACADWARGEVKGTSDAKKKATEFKEKFQTCLSKNGLPSSLAFSGKYKP